VTNYALICYCLVSVFHEPGIYDTDQYWSIYIMIYTAGYISADHSGNIYIYIYIYQYDDIDQSYDDRILTDIYIY
jgi:hypothetical protein